MILIMCDPTNNSVIVSTQDQWPAYQAQGKTLYNGPLDEYGHPSDGNWCRTQAGLPPVHHTGEYQPQYIPSSGLLPSTGASFTIPLILAISTTVLYLLIKRIIIKR